MVLSEEVKQKITEEFEGFKAEMYAGRTQEERQKLGQFFTPPEVSIQMIERFKWDTLKEKKILDPTSGSGNLLAAALIAGADPDKIFGNEYDAVMVDVCRKRLQKINPKVQDWQIHRGNALIQDCLTKFGPDYDETILAALLKKRWGLKGGWMDNPEHYSYEAQVDLF